MTTTQTENFGDRVRRARRLAGLSTDGLAKRSGLWASEVNRVENGLTPSPRVREGIAAGLGLEAEDLFG